MSKLKDLKLGDKVKIKSISPENKDYGVGAFSIYKYKGKIGKITCISQRFSWGLGNGGRGSIEVTFEDNSHDAFHPRLINLIKE